MKKLVALGSTVAYLFSTAKAFAQDIQIGTPKIGDKDVGYSDISKFVNNIVSLIFIVATIIVLFMLVWGAVEWIFSGGNKEAVASARGRIIHALVGFAILAVAFAIAKLAGQFLGFDITGTLPIPHP